MCDHIHEKDYGHKPVLLHECLDALAIRPDGVYVDGTLGRAGHSLEIVRRLTAGGRLIGIDRDQTAIDAARERLASYLDRVTLVHSNFDRIGDILADLHIPGVDGMLFDLGVSSPQLDDAARTETLLEICRRTNDLSLLLPLYTSSVTRAYSDRLGGVEVGPSGTMRYQDLYIIK